MTLATRDAARDIQVIVGDQRGDALGAGALGGGERRH
jgi:hypothetical protein